MGFQSPPSAAFAAAPPSLLAQGRIIHNNPFPFHHHHNHHLPLNQLNHPRRIRHHHHQVHTAAFSSSTLHLSPTDVDWHTTTTTASHLWHSSLHLADAAISTSSNLLTNVLTTAEHELEQAMHNNFMEQIDIPEEIQAESLNAVGHDFMLFLGAAVLVEPLGKILNVTPVLLYLILGAVAGPYGLSLFQSGTEVNSELGDFGILFLLFVEGLNLSPERLKALGSFFSLGATQLLLSVGIIFFGFFFGGPYLFPFIQDVRVPIDETTFALLEKPVIAFSIAAAGALSSSAFVLPILKEKKWEKRPDGIAALSILLLQDLAVAPLLVALPLIAEWEANGGSIQDPSSLGVLAAKATLGFGVVLALASVVLRKIFQVVASYGSSQTFVAASLLVAVGMGVIADDLGLSSTTGAFAAGVLLAESGYRAQIEADIKPFEGILLGVFFVTAGASIDPQVCIEQWSTLVAGTSFFIAVKLLIIYAAGQTALGLTKADSARIALLLAGGGEFAFVVFKLAESLDVLPDSLAKLLTASVIISMSLTPILGELAEWYGNILEDTIPKKVTSWDLRSANGDYADDTYDVNLTDENLIREAFESFDEDGNGAISVEELQLVLKKPGTSNELLSLKEVKAVMSRFDENGDDLLQFDEFAALWTAKRRGTALEPDCVNAVPAGLSNAVVVCGYGEVGQRLCAAMDHDKAAGIAGGVSYVAFSRDPSRISLGVMNGATVVYGNGASPALIRSSGVENPSAFAITYEGEGRCLEATIRLRDAFPTVPIYVRATRQERVKQLMEAGATEVIVETDKVAESMRTLVERYGDETLELMNEVAQARGKHDGQGQLSFTDIELADLAYECNKNPQELLELYELFDTSLNANERGEVQLAELRNELLRRRDQPMDDSALAEWMGYDESLSKWKTGNADNVWVTFPDFVRFSARLLDPKDD